MGFKIQVCISRGWHVWNNDISANNKPTTSIFIAGSSPNRDDSEGGAESTPSHSIDEGDIAGDQQGEGATAR